MASPDVRTRRRTLLVGSLVAAVIGGVLYISATAHTGLPWSTTTTVRAAFDNTASLKVGDQVRQYSARIGKVSAIDFADGRAVVTMQLDGDREVYRDARATILDFSALAQKFVELDPGTEASGELGDGVVEVDRTVGSDDLYKVLDVFDEPTREAAASTLREVGGGAAGHGKDLHDWTGAASGVLDDVATVSDALVDPAADLPALLRNTDRLATRFVDRRGDVEAVVRDFATTAEAVTVDDATPLKDTLRTLPGTLEQANGAFAALDRPLADTRTAFADLQPGLAGLGQATPDLRGVLREAPRPLDKVPGVADQAEPVLPQLTEAVADARPFAPHLVGVVDDLQQPLEVLEPYSKELGYLIVRLHSFVSESVAPGIHYARVNANVGVPTLTSGPLKDSVFFPHNPYPAPGEATFDRAGSSGGNR